MIINYKKEKLEIMSVFLCVQAHSGFGHIGTFLNITKGDSINEFKVKGENLCKEDWNVVIFIYFLLLVLIGVQPFDCKSAFCSCF